MEWSEQMVLAVSDKKKLHTTFCFVMPNLSQTLDTLRKASTINVVLLFATVIKSRLTNNFLICHSKFLRTFSIEYGSRRTFDVTEKSCFGLDLQNAYQTFK